jgi:oligopeptide transport system ATP-binding protein
MTPMTDEATSTILVRVDNLKVYFPILKGLFQHKTGDVKAVDGVSFEIFRGETLGLVGESGCGKTTTGRAILQIYHPTKGKIFLENVEISALNKHDLQKVRRRMQMVFQDPYASLNPRLTAGQIVSEPLEIHRIFSGKDRQDRVAELFKVVGLLPDLMNRYPHEFSGGQRQRIGLARALALDPEFIVCDEPIAALDVSIQAQVINLLYDLQERLNLTYLFIAHDLSMVRHMSDRIAVMYLGKIVELTESNELYNTPLHPYTQALLSAVPIPDPDLEEQRQRILLKGDIPSPANPPSGCHFHTRCNKAQEVCREQEPLFREVKVGHRVACHFAGV